MKRNTGISAVILSAILISSCASERLQYARQEVPDCKTPNTRYIKSTAKPVRALKSVNRKYARHASGTGWNKGRHRNLTQLIVSIKKYPGKTSSRIGEVTNIPTVTPKRNYNVLAVSERPFSQQINLNFPEFEYLNGLPESNNNKGDILSVPSEKIIFPGADTYILPVKDSPGNAMIPDINDEPVESVSAQMHTTRSQEKPFLRNEAMLMLIALMAGLTTFAAVRAAPGLTSKISWWAAANPWKTRIMFTGVNIGLGFGGVFLGKELAVNDVQFSKVSGDILLAAFIASGLLYPLRNSSIRLLRHSYLKQKALDLALALSGFMLMVHAGSDPEMFSTLTRSVGLKNLGQASSDAPVENVAASSKFLYFQDVNRVQDEQAVQKKKERSKEAKIMLTILSVLGALGLGFLLAVAACGIYCNGLEALAYITGIGGGVLIIVLAIWVIKSIWHPRRKKKGKPAIVTESFATPDILKT